ncbi:prophage integrase (pseudogene) [Salmonella enterica subsp. enterica]|nr:prophage integrase (pseudogene) [Salmonella enterica subsp. enterica]
MHQQTANAALIRMGFGGETGRPRHAQPPGPQAQVIFPVKSWNLCWHTRKKDEIEAAYNRSDYLEQRRPLMQWWGNYVDAARRQALLGAEEPAANRGRRIM